MLNKEIEDFELAEGIRIHTVDEGRILIVQCTTIQRESIDKLIAWLKDRIASWDADLSYLALYDLSLPGAMLTPYMRTRTAEVNAQRDDVRGRVAMVMRRDTTANLLSMFTQLRENNQRPLRVWFNRTDALAWLREEL